MSTEPSNPLVRLHALGQRLWLDYIRRDLIQEGQLLRMIEEDRIAGVTSNPSIFENAITRHSHYDEATSALLAEGVSSAEGLYTAITQDDIRGAADVFRPLWTASQGKDGYVSLEVSPHLAHNTEATINEARRLWRSVDRPNLMVKVPGTTAGLPALTALIAEGINVNVTLLFSVERYLSVHEAFVAGLEHRRDQNLPLDGVASVASFFISRIDALIDPQLPNDSALRGKTAIASAGSAYLEHLAMIESPRWQDLEHNHGAMPQRLLWASTSTKNPNYPDTKYVDALIAPNTVNTLPPATLDAYRDHGDPALRLASEARGAPALLRELAESGIDLEAACAQLEQAGVDQFIQAHDRLLGALDAIVREARGQTNLN